MDKPLNKKQIKSQATLELLRATVDKLVLEVGFDNMHIRDICKEAGVTPGAFYHYFESKNELLRDRHNRAAATSKKLYEDKLSKMHAVDALKAYIEFFAEYTDTRVIGVLIKYSMIRLEDYQKWDADVKEGKALIIESLVQKGVETGEIASTYSNEQIISTIKNMTEGMISLQCMSKGEYLSHEELLEPIFDWIEALRA